MNGNKSRLRRKVAENATVGASKRTTRRLYQQLKGASNLFVQTLSKKYEQARVH